MVARRPLDCLPVRTQDFSSPRRTPIQATTKIRTKTISDKDNDNDKGEASQVYLDFSLRGEAILR